MQIQEQRVNYLYERILTPLFTWPETANIFETGTEYYIPFFPKKKNKATLNLKLTFATITEVSGLLNNNEITEKMKKLISTADEND